MRLPFSSVALIFTIFAKNVVNTSLANNSSSQSTPTGLCNKPPVNNCNCQCRLTQNPQLSNAVKALEKKLKNLTQNSQLSNAVKALEKKLENLTQNSQLSNAVKTLEKKLENLTQNSQLSNAVKALEKKLENLTHNSQLSNAVKALEKKLDNLTQNSQLSNAVKALEKKLENLTQNSQLSDAMKGLEKKLENLIALVNKSSFDVAKPFPPADAIISSCKEQYERDNSSRSQVYNLTTGNQQIPVYCHMGKFGNFGCGDGGWTMVMKMDGMKRTFHYNSNLWSNMNAYNPAGGQSGFDKQETKLPTYWNTPFSTICLGMRIGTQLNLAIINRQATSLSSLIADGSYRATSLSRTSWKSLIGSAGSLQTRCNREGFNVASERASHAKVRIGIIANNENDCKTSNSRIGFGGGGIPDDSNTCGNAAELRTDNGDKFIHAMGYILVQ